MEENKEKSSKTQKMSYEELERVASQLSEQVRQLYSQLQQVNYANMFHRLDYLFKVLEHDHMFNSTFIDNCIEEIEEIITIPEDTKEGNTESKTEK